MEWSGKNFIGVLQSTFVSFIITLENEVNKYVFIVLGTKLILSAFFLVEENCIVQQIEAYYFGYYDASALFKYLLLWIIELQFDYFKQNQSSGKNDNFESFVKMKMAPSSIFF